MATGIQWTDETWNPVTGCTKVSPGCAHCYAETVALRLWPMQYPPVNIQRYEPDICATVDDQRSRKFTDVQCHEDRLDQPLRWKRPRRVFVNSMSDLFHEAVPDDFLHRVYHVMEHAGQHTFQILTKRAERMRDYLTWRYGPDDDTPRGRVPSRHIWHGVSIENQHWADIRIPLLLTTRSAVRFISYEPALGPVMLHHAWLYDYATGRRDHDFLDWVICGGESGAGARPFQLEWAVPLPQPDSGGSGARVEL